MQKTLLSAVGATTTSEAINVENIGRLVITFLCSGHSSGNGVFTVDGSADGINWVTGLAAQDATATAATTWVTSKTLNADGTAAVYIPSGWKMIRVKVVFTTDGAYSAFLSGNKIEA